MRSESLCVLHVANLEDGDALDALAHTTQVLATQDVEQLLIGLNERDRAPLLPGVAAKVRPLRCAGVSLVQRIGAVQAEIERLVRGRTLYAVHFHGEKACFLGLRALKSRAAQVRVVYSPSRSSFGARCSFGARWGARLVGRLLRRQLARFNYAPLAGSAEEAAALSRVLKRSAEVLPHPVAEAFFEVSRQEHTLPCIVAQGAGGAAIDIVTRLCVLLNGRETRVRFSWMGAASPAAREQLAAANVSVLDIADDAGRAQTLARAWISVHLSPGAALPHAVADAMAVGVPCLVSDSPAHRALVRHGETGFVCTSERDFLEKAVLLLRDGAERERIGGAARAEAERRFTEQEFQRALLRAYGFSLTRTARPAADTERTPWAELRNSVV